MSGVWGLGEAAGAGRASLEEPGVGNVCREIRDGATDVLWHSPPQPRSVEFRWEHGEGTLRMDLGSPEESFRPSCVPQKGTAGMWIHGDVLGTLSQPLVLLRLCLCCLRSLSGLRQIFGKSSAGSSHRSTKQHQDSREALLEPFPWEQKALEALPARMDGLVLSKHSKLENKSGLEVC